MMCLWLPLSAQLRIESQPALAYPALARQARVSGEVVLEYSIGGDRKPSSIDLLSGSPFLSDSAKSNLASWRFADGDAVRFQVTYVFEFSNEPGTGRYDATKERVEFEGIRRVRVITEPHSSCWAEKCPPTPVSLPSGAIRADDFVRMSRSCFGSCPAYELTLHGDGRLTWRGIYYVSKSGKASAPVAAGDAEHFLGLFRTADVGSLRRIHGGHCGRRISGG